MGQDYPPRCSRRWRWPLGRGVKSHSGSISAGRRSSRAPWTARGRSSGAARSRRRSRTVSGRSARRSSRPRISLFGRQAPRARASRRSRLPRRAPWTPRRGSSSNPATCPRRTGRFSRPCAGLFRRRAAVSKTTCGSPRSARRGAGRGAETMVAVWVGTGIGGAVIRGGKIHSGKNRNAGEIGMTRIDFRRVKAGSLEGTLESVAAKVGITAWLRRRIAEGEKTCLEKAVSRKGARLKGSQLREAVEAKDALALRALARSAKAVGLAMANVFNVFSPDLFVLGGGVAVDVEHVRHRE